MQLSTLEQHCALAWAYLDSNIEFSVDALGHHPILSPIHGAITQNSGFFGMFTESSNKFYHSYAFTLSMLERGSIRVLQTHDNKALPIYGFPEPFDVDASHYAFWVTARALMCQSSLCDTEPGFFDKVHKRAMAHYLMIPLVPQYDATAEYLLVKTAGRVKKEKALRDLTHFLTVMEKHLALAKVGVTDREIIQRFMLRADALKAIMQSVKAPGCLFDTVQQPPIFLMAGGSCAWMKMAGKAMDD